MTVSGVSVETVGTLSRWKELHVHHPLALLQPCSPGWYLLSAACAVSYRLSIDLGATVYPSTCAPFWGVQGREVEDEQADKWGGQ